jgi:hypothetical protein
MLFILFHLPSHLSKSTVIFGSEVKPLLGVIPIERFGFLEKRNSDLLVAYNYLVLLFARDLCESDSLGQLSLCQPLLLSLQFACCLFHGLKLAVTDFS